MSQTIKNQIESAIEELYANNQYKLRQICNKEMARFGGLSPKDYDGFYSRAGLEISVAKKNNTYNPSKGKTPLEFFTGVIKWSIWKEMTDRNRGKRHNFIETEETDEDGNVVKKKKFVPTVSIDMPISDDGNMTIGDTLQSDFDINDVLLNECVDENVEKFLCSLPLVARKIIEMKMECIPVSIIKSKLELSDKEYIDYMNYAKINENLALFTKTSNRYFKEENKMCNIIPIDVTDNYRMDKFPLGSLLDDMRDGKINKKHILQREPFQWTERQKNKFLTRVLNGQPIPEIVICEQVINGKKKSHLIDGLQRLSYSELFRADGIVVKIDGAEFYEIPYKEYKYDNKGNVLLDEDGDALFEEKIFNVIGKKFSEFPQFLKERFNKFNINVTTYFNCTDDQIAYHIRNYNNQEGMNKNQYEFTGVNMSTATDIKDISKNHPFFKDNYGKYTAKNKTKGDIDKVVVESIMTVNFLSDWKKEVKDSFAYVNKHATDEMFSSFKDTLDRLCKVVDKEIKNIFTTTNSPVWFAIFDKFKGLNIPDNRFKDFVIYIRDSLDDLYVNGESFKEIYKSKNTRDKTIVTKKVNDLITLMYEFLHIDKNLETENSISSVEFIADAIDVDEEVIKEDLEAYEEDLDMLLDNTVKIGAKLRDKENRLSLLTMVAYAYKVNFDLDKWFAQYVKTDTYYKDQKINFIHMRNDFDEYIKKCA